MSRKVRFFFPEFNIRLYDKNSESDFFSLNIGNQNIFLKKTITLQVKWSVPNGSCNVRQSSLLSNLYSNLEQIYKTAEEHMLLLYYD